MSLPPPAGLTAELLTATQVRLTWLPLIGAVAHLVFKDGVQVGTGNDSFVDNSYDNTLGATYQVRGVSIEFDADLEPRLTPGAAATIVVPAASVPITPPVSLAAPTALQVLQSAADALTLTYDIAGAATHVEVETDGGTPERLSVQETFTETGLGVGTSRSYRVRAVTEAPDPEVVSDWAGPVEATVVTLAAPAINVTVDSSTNIIVDWAAVPGAAAYDAAINGEVTQLGTLTLFHHSNLTPATS